MIQACFSSTSPFWCYTNSLVETNPITTTIMLISTVAITTLAITCCLKPMSFEFKKVSIQETIDGNKRISTAYSAKLEHKQNQETHQLIQPLYRLMNGDMKKDEPN